MSPFDIDGPNSLKAVRRIDAVARHQARSPAAGAAPAAAPALAARKPAVARLDPGQPPENTERVVEIRKAIETGDYPLVPARIADAMIAAGMLLRKGG